MKLLNSLKLTAIFVFAVAVGFGVSAAGHKALAANNNSQTQANSNSNKNKKSNKTTAKPVVYNYVAQDGDSYTLLARKAVETYGIKYKVNISQAGIIYAETNLQIAAGSPDLDLGQKVDVSEATVKSWVDKAKNLTKAEQDAWAVYVPLVDFDTSHVGQSS